MTRIVEFEASFVTPTDDEIREGIEYARRENCIVRINYFKPYYGYYQLNINPKSTFEDCQRRLSNDPVSAMSVSKIDHRPTE